MQFTVAYRGADGSMVTEVVEATNRADCFSRMKSRGIVPTSVEEGQKGKSADSTRGGVHGRDRRDKSGSGGKGKGRQASKSKVPHVLFVALIALAAGGIWWWMSQRGGNTMTNRTNAPRRAVGRPNGASVGTGDRSDGDALDKGDDSVKSVAPQKNVATSAGTDGLGVPEFSDSVDGTPDVPTPPPVFNNVSDQVLAMAVSADSHGMPPIPISHNIEAEFLASLNHEIVILDTDDESTRAMKEAVKEARAEMKRLVDSGMTVSQVLAEHQKLANENARVRNDAMMELSELVRSGDIEGAKEYKRKVNIALEQMGIEGLTIPVTEEERAERAALRRERMLKKREEQAKAAEMRSGNAAGPTK